MVKEFEIHPYTGYLNKRYGTYSKWSESEELPLYGGMFIKDVKEVPLKPWKRKGGLGAFLRFSDQNLVDAYIAEISPGKTLNPQKHLYEELILIVSGRGATEVWVRDGRRQLFKWEAGSMFAIPPNAWHRHFNEGNTPARYFAATNAPMLMDLFTDTDFVFNNDFIFANRFRGEENYFSTPGRYLEDVYGGLLETNFIPDIRQVKLFPREKRGAGTRNLYICLAGSTMAAHISEFPVGRYKTAHRHGPGYHVYMLNSRGYTLMWPEDQPRQRFDWQVDSVITPPAGWYHQHFNTGKEPAKFVAFHPSHAIVENPKVTDEGQQIELEDEDPEIRAMYEQELRRQGVPTAMPPVGETARQ